MDQLVIQSEPFDAVGKREAQSVRLSKRLARFPVATDILLYARDEVEYWRDSLNHAVARALREGTVLYERRQIRKSDPDSTAKPDRNLRSRHSPFRPERKP